MNYQKKKLTINPAEDIENFRRYLYERENAEATVRKYSTDIGTFIKYLDGMFDINKERILKYKSWLLENYAVTSVNSMLAALNQFLEYVGGSSMKVKRIKVQKSCFLSEDRDLTRKDYERLLCSARESGKYVLALIMETLASTGIRISELGCFTVEKVKTGKIDVINKGKCRTILISDKLKKKLLYYAAKKKIYKGCIFITREGNSQNRSNIWRAMKALCKSAGVDRKRVFPHNFRHLFARLYYKTTRDLTGLADILGHSSIEITRIYTMDTGREYRINMEKMQLALSSGSCGRTT